MPLTVVLSSAISPLASTSIVSLKSPLATACPYHQLNVDDSTCATYLGDLGNTPHLIGEICRKLVHDCRELSPSALDSFHNGLTSQSPLSTNFEGDPLNLDRKSLQSVHHGIYDVL